MTLITAEIRAFIDKAAAGVKLVGDEYMETVETAQDTKAEAYGIGTAGMGSL